MPVNITSTTKGKNKTIFPDLSLKNDIPEHLIWRIMRKGTKRPISGDAVNMMAQHINHIIEDATQKADNSITELNEKLPPRYRRQRINVETILEAINAKF